MSYARRNDPSALSLPALEGMARGLRVVVSTHVRNGRTADEFPPLAEAIAELAEINQAIDEAQSDMYDGVEAYASDDVPVDKLPRHLRGKVKRFPINQ